MSDIVTAMTKLEEQLRAQGYKGTHKAMRLLKKLRLALQDAGYEFVPNQPQPKKTAKK